MQAVVADTPLPCPCPISFCRQCTNQVPQRKALDDLDGNHSCANRSGDYAVQLVEYRGIPICRRALPTEKATVLSVLVQLVKLVQVCLVQLEVLNRNHWDERSPSASCETTLQMRANYD